MWTTLLGSAFLNCNAQKREGERKDCLKGVVGGALLVYRVSSTGDFGIYPQGKEGPGALPRKVFDV